MRIGIVVILLSLVALVGCNPGGAVAESGPRAWIDSPEGGTLLPLAPVEIISHATDPGGIDQVELSVNGAVQSTNPVTETTALGTMRQTWTPTANGQYTISIRAHSRAGMWTPTVSVEVTVGEDFRTPGSAPSAEPPTAVTFTPIASLTPGGPIATPTSAEATVQPRLRYVYEPDFITAGECFTLTWEGQNVQNVIVQGNAKPVQGSETFCPTVTTNYTLSADGPAGRIAHQFTMVVNAPTAPTATPTIEAPPPPLPGIGAISKSGTNLDETTGCGGPSAVTITAAVGNASSVVLNFGLAGGTWKQLSMNNTGGDSWTATLRQDNEITDSGQLEYYVTASNAAGSVQGPTLADITINTCKP